jgi:HEAT repeat protein
MLAICIGCWREIQSEKHSCSYCGARIDAESPSYERFLFWVLKNSQPEHRAEVCRILGLRGRSSAVPHLLEALNDRAIFVRVAALRALGAIGEESAIPAIEKSLTDESLAVRIAAEGALKEMGVARHAPTAAAD